MTNLASSTVDAVELADCECGLDALRIIRAIRGLSLNETARRAQISSAYLQKLERREVKDPSPRVLFRLAEALDFPYAKLMQHAGYVVPGLEDLPRYNLAVLADAIGSDSDSLGHEETEILSHTLREYRLARDAGINIGIDLFAGTIREIRRVQERRQGEDPSADLTLSAISGQ